MVDAPSPLTFLGSRIQLTMSGAPPNKRVNAQYQYTPQTHTSGTPLATTQNETPLQTRNEHQPRAQQSHQARPP